MQHLIRIIPYAND